MEEPTNTTSTDSELIPPEVELVEELELETTIDYSTGDVLTTFPVEIDVTEMRLHRLTSAEHIDPLTRPPASWYLEQLQKELSSEVDKPDNTSC